MNNPVQLHILQCSDTTFKMSITAGKSSCSHTYHHSHNVKAIVAGPGWLQYSQCVLIPRLSLNATVTNMPFLISLVRRTPPHSPGYICAHSSSGLSSEHFLRAGSLVIEVFLSTPYLFGNGERNRWINKAQSLATFKPQLQQLDMQ